MRLDMPYLHVRKPAINLISVVWVIHHMHNVIIIIIIIKPVINISM